MCERLKNYEFEIFIISVCIVAAFIIIWVVSVIFDNAHNKDKRIIALETDNRQLVIENSDLKYMLKTQALNRTQKREVISEKNKKILLKEKQYQTEMAWKTK